MTTDEERFAEISDALADRLDAVVAGWITGLVLERARADGIDTAGEVTAVAARAGAAAAAELMPAIRQLLAADIDEQAANPLSLLRAVTGHATAALSDLGVAPAARDEFAQRSFPDDVYDLAPATWADVDPELHRLGISWGAAKAFLHKQRRHAGRPEEGTT